MPKSKKEIKKSRNLLTFIVDNYFILIFLACIGFVGVVSFYKLFVSKPHYVYVKVRLGQGLWWASTVRPSIWFIKAIKKGDVSVDLTGKPTAEILEVRYYPWTGSNNQYEVYVTLKLKVSGLGKTGKYNFNRSTIGVGAPIDLEFPSTQFSGTITQLSESPIKEKYIEKTITLTKALANVWEFDAIKKGDYYFDGADKIFQIMDKEKSYVQEYILSQKGAVNTNLTDERITIAVKAKIKVKDIDQRLYFAEDQVITPGKALYVSTSNLTLIDYMISKVE